MGNTERAHLIIDFPASKNDLIRQSNTISG
jgi:hypothetical protein